MDKRKIVKFLSHLVNSNIFIYSVFTVFSLLLGASIWLFFPVSSSGVHYYSLGLYALLAVGIIIFVSYIKDWSIPLVKTILKKEYHRIKFKHCKKSRKPILARAYLKALSYLILLFKSSKDSFEVLKEDVFAELSELASKIKIRKKKQPMVPIFIKVCLGILGYIISIFKYITLLFKSSGDNFNLLSDSIFVKFDKLVDEVNKDGVEDKFMAIRQTIDKIKKKEKVDENYLKELEKELFEFNKIKQKKATVFSLTAITALIITTVTAGLISSFLFPEVFKTKAATYGFVQTSWAGGASSDNATHSNQTGWTKYLSKDNVSTTTPTELKLSLTTTTIFTQTSDSDWQTHATTSTYYLNGSVGIAKPNGLTCSVAVECNSGLCVGGYCCNTACTSACSTCTNFGEVGTCTNDVTFTYNGGSVTYQAVSSQGECWLDRNLGASRAATAFDDSAAYGDLFQWGRDDDGHQLRTSNTTATLSGSDTPGHSNFITSPNSPWDWRSPQNDNLWQGVNGANNPCPSGWRLPTQDELVVERVSWGSADCNGAFGSPLKLTVAGYRSAGNGGIGGNGSSGAYYSGSTLDVRIFDMRFNCASYAGTTGDYRAGGESVRCIKN